ncbi:hypothetical protein H0H81_008682 [Sphagnurus paluster]|uniref:Uncharacterized protein n=1 Tax=Sphagnurus paluster TaxID=117069 RepID=A0A9P7FYZ4_9AGAR|nr:hypothetical protein H0H81_008682 [Sphagnurus paluster]
MSSHTQHTESAHRQSLGLELRALLVAQRPVHIILVGPQHPRIAPARLVDSASSSWRGIGAGWGVGRDVVPPEAEDDDQDQDQDQDGNARIVEVENEDGDGDGDGDDVQAQVQVQVEPWTRRPLPQIPVLAGVATSGGGTSRSPGSDGEAQRHAPPPPPAGGTGVPEGASRATPPVIVLVPPPQSSVLESTQDTSAQGSEHPGPSSVPTAPRSAQYAATESGTEIPEPETQRMPGAEYYTEYLPTPASQASRGARAFQGLGSDTATPIPSSTPLPASLSAQSTAAATRRPSTRNRPARAPEGARARQRASRSLRSTNTPQLEVPGPTPIRTAVDVDRVPPAPPPEIHTPATGMPQQRGARGQAPARTYTTTAQRGETQRPQNPPRAQRTRFSVPNSESRREQRRRSRARPDASAVPSPPNSPPPAGRPAPQLIYHRPTIRVAEGEAGGAAGARSRAAGRQRTSSLRRPSGAWAERLAGNQTAAPRAALRARHVATALRENQDPASRSAPVNDAQAAGNQSTTPGSSVGSFPLPTVQQSSTSSRPDTAANAPATNQPAPPRRPIPERDGKESIHRLPLLVNEMLCSSCNTTIPALHTPPGHRASAAVIHAICPQPNCRTMHCRGCASAVRCRPQCDGKHHCRAKNCCPQSRAVVIYAYLSSLDLFYLKSFDDSAHDVDPSTPTPTPAHVPAESATRDQRVRWLNALFAGCDPNAQVLRKFERALLRTLKGVNLWLGHVSANSPIDDSVYLLLSHSYLLEIVQTFLEDNLHWDPGYVIRSDMFVEVLQLLLSLGSRDVLHNLVMKPFPAIHASPGLHAKVWRPEELNQFLPDGHERLCCPEVRVIAIFESLRELDSFYIDEVEQFCKQPGFNGPTAQVSVDRRIESFCHALDFKEWAARPSFRMDFQLQLLKALKSINVWMQTPLDTCRDHTILALFRTSLLLEAIYVFVKSGVTWQLFALSWQTNVIPFGPIPNFGPDTLHFPSVLEVPHDTIDAYCEVLHSLMYEIDWFLIILGNYPSMRHLVSSKTIVPMESLGVENWLQVSLMSRYQENERWKVQEFHESILGLFLERWDT